MKEEKISARKLDKNGEVWIAVQIPKATPLITAIKQVPGRRWDVQEQVWLVPYDKDRWNRLLGLFPELKSQYHDKDAEKPIPAPNPSMMLQIPVPKCRTDLIERIRQVHGRRWNPGEKVWEAPDTEVVRRQVEAIFGDHRRFKRKAPGTSRVGETKSKKQSNPEKERPPLQYESEVIRLEEQLRLRRYSWRTVKTYLHHFRSFLSFFNAQDPEFIEGEAIRNWLLYLVKERKVSASAQNQAINAVKFYYEQVLNRPRQTYYVERPKKPVQLPNVLSEEEVIALFRSIDNLKHRCILMVIYSGGLRISEAINLAAIGFVQT